MSMHNTRMSDTHGMVVRYGTSPLDFHDPVYAGMGDKPSGFHVREIAEPEITDQERQLAQMAANRVLVEMIFGDSVPRRDPRDDPEYRGHFTPEQLTEIARGMSDGSNVTRHSLDRSDGA